MGTTRFAYTNKLESATILNAPSADAVLVAANSKNGQRYIPWRSAAGPPSPVDIEFDLGSAQAVTIAALLNIPPVVIGGSTTQITSVAVESASAAGGPWTNRATITPAGLTDIGAVFASQTFRYWRFRLTNNGIFSVGELWLGVVQQDIGMQFAPGTIKGHRKNRSRVESAAGLKQSFYHSRNLHQWSLNYETATDAMRASLDDVFQQRKFILFIDENDTFYQVEHQEDAWGAAVIFDNIHDSRFVIEELV